MSIPALGTGADVVIAAMGLSEQDQGVVRKYVSTHKDASNPALDMYQIALLAGKTVRELTDDDAAIQGSSWDLADKAIYSSVLDKATKREFYKVAPRSAEERQQNTKVEEVARNATDVFLLLSVKYHERPLEKVTARQKELISSIEKRAMDKMQGIVAASAANCIIC